MNENEHTICIVSGGQGYNEPFPEAEGMFRYMKEKGFHVFRALQTAKAQGLRKCMRHCCRFKPSVFAK